MYAKHDNMSSPLTSELVIHGQFFFSQFRYTVFRLHQNHAHKLSSTTRC